MAEVSARPVSATVEEFVRAASAGRLTKVRELWATREFEHVDARNDAGMTALLAAADQKHVEIARFLLEQGASTECQNPESFTPLHFAAARDDVSMTVLLCAFGAAVEARDRRGVTALHLALLLGCLDVARSLLDHGAPVDVVDTNGTSVLLLACLHADESLVARMLNTIDGVEAKRRWVSQPGLDAKTPLIVAAVRGDVRLATLLVRHGAELNAKALDSFSALSIAATSCHDGIARLLLEHGADTETTTAGDATPLVRASQHGFSEIVELLLAHGAVVGHRTINGRSALFEAAMGGHDAIVDSLLRAGAIADFRDNTNSTPLMAAAQNGHLYVVQQLLNWGADPDAQDDHHMTPLAVGVPQGHVAVCTMLVQRGASTTFRTPGGLTPLHLAALHGHREIIDVLLTGGADASARDFRGRSVAHTAMMEGHLAIAGLLESAAQAMIEDDDLIWPRHSLRELFEESNTTTGREQTLASARRDPPWFIDRASITAVEPCARLTTPFAHVSSGTWDRSRVLIIEPRIPRPEEVDLSFSRDSILASDPGATIRTMKALFREEVRRLYPLRHSHVVRLYGAGHRGEHPFLVMEHPQNGTLRSLVRENPHRAWAILREAALGVLYLHERGIIHGRLRGDTILVGDDGLVKLAAFGLYSLSLYDDSIYLWEPPERLASKQPPTAESDIYSLGMCIVEALSGETPYAYEASEGLDVQEGILRGMPPIKPAAFGTRGWELVLQMVRLEPSVRLKMADIVRELTLLATEEVTGFAPPRGLSVGIEDALALAFTLLSADDLPESQVFQRLMDVWKATERLPEERVHFLLPPLGDLVMRFKNFVESDRDSGRRAARFAAARQHADRIVSFHNEIDRLMSQHSLPSAAMSVDGVHAWRDRWLGHRRKQLAMFGSSLARVKELDVESATCLLFELTRRVDAYASIPPQEIHAACAAIRAIRGVYVPEWFIPFYEVNFDEFQSFSRGGFGSVHHGEWMGSRVVVKKVFAHDDSEFEKEVGVWSRLYHPHILQLFGASHVGQKFLVSELASKGQLDQYLYSLEKEPRQRAREVWRLLLEAALGLQYLHSCGLLHCDLKCNNILVGSDGKAKLADYGLSRPYVKIDDREDDTPTPTGVGALRWKAPEVLNGAAPTVASDIYAFGMCVVEAVTGEYPWGDRDPDEEVSHHVRSGDELFAQPQAFNEAQWKLVLGACRFDPEQRSPLQQLIEQLQVFADEASVRGDRDEPEPETGAISLRSGRTEFSDANAQSAGASSEREPKGYSESW